MHKGRVKDREALKARKREVKKTKKAFMQEQLLESERRRQRAQDTEIRLAVPRETSLRNKLPFPDLSSGPPDEIIDCPICRRMTMNGFWKIEGRSVCSACHRRHNAG